MLDILSVVIIILVVYLAILRRRMDTMRFKIRYSIDVIDSLTKNTTYVPGGAERTKKMNEDSYKKYTKILNTESRIEHLVIGTFDQVQGDENL